MNHNYKGQASSLMPDYAKAKISAVKIFELLDRITSIDNWNSENGDILDSSSIDGEIKFESVGFSYPTRSDIKVLDNFNITINKGQQIALGSLLLYYFSLLLVKAIRNSIKIKLAHLGVASLLLCNCLKDFMIPIQDRSP